VLAEHIRDLDHEDFAYERVVLMGHSMGGLICQGAICNLIESQMRTADGELVVARIAGLFLMATPQAGSLRSPNWAVPWSSDARILAPHSEYVKKIQVCLASRVQVSINEPASSNRFRIPTYALIATGDRWVDSFSSKLGLPRDQIKTIHGSHTSLVKPSTRAADGYRWLLNSLQQPILVARPNRDSPIRTIHSFTPDKPKTPSGNPLEQIIVRGSTQDVNAFVASLNQQIAEGGMQSPNQLYIDLVPDGWAGAGNGRLRDGEPSLDDDVHGV
jgi:pimeloyl-ACP methyl ester carboxylesterase